MTQSSNACDNKFKIENMKLITQQIIGCLRRTYLDKTAPPIRATHLNVVLSFTPAFALAFTLLTPTASAIACGAAALADDFKQITTARPFTQTQDNTLQVFSRIEPTGVQVTNDGKVIVLDSERALITVSDLKGVTLMSFGSVGKAPGALASPKGLAVDVNGDMYIADTGNNRIQRFTSTGRFVASWGGFGYADEELISPTGIVVDSRYVYVSDTGKNRIVVFKKNGKFVRAFGKYGARDTDFNQPVGLALNARGHLLIADSQNDKIKTFTSNGAFVSAWGARGDLPGQVITPFGLAYSQGKIYLAELGGHRIQIFDDQGKYLSAFSTPPKQLLATDIRLHYPAAIAISPNGKHKIACEPLHIRCESFSNDKSIHSIVQEDSARWEKGPTKFHYGGGIAIDGDVMAVIDAEQHGVLLFDISGRAPKLVDAIGGFGSNAGQFKSPSGIAVDSDSNLLYVSDAHNHRVQVFNLQYDKRKQLESVGFRIALGGYGAGEDEFNEPAKLVKDKQGKVYVLDVNNNRIQVIGPEYGSTEVVGIAKGKIKMLSSTISFSLSPDQKKIYLVDNDSNKIKIINIDGELVDELGERQAENRQRQHQADRFIFPYDVAVDEKGFVYASDLVHQKIKKFDSQGKHIMDWGSWGSAVGEFYKPKNIAIDSRNKRLYTIDFGNYRGQIFDYKGKFEGVFGIGHAQALKIKK